MIFPIGCFEQIATKHTIPQITENLFFLGQNQIITHLGQQDENKPCKVKKIPV